ncbi:glycoside hydrolase family 65 protein [Paenibacillus macquariensis]|uniref:Alpha,alpha-trehalose phosphorylase n=1 Tax=Paenibacillus macquariensis TaxID=948756 RepID=A0ABY1JNV7_9BACL|nr:glycosyl hydrolase family 65 protein [Paenibacillus macquariensis]MEC0092111.1 glycosyl hydrolase family 65 protein [Paenibacillus macquariensis]OAB37328.1 glycoside hydrolase family 65 [Paenibacillus macquariensis subsp. macquariensis]SIQ50926.1 alpha,alpha-trehalose phosphorylase [Paenibacillus macquariensis]
MTWRISNHAISVETLLNLESIFALGNGYLGVRGNFEEGYAEGMDSIRGTYLNAFHDVINIPYGEKLFAFPSTQQKLVNGIDSQSIRLFIGEEEEPFSLFDGKVLSYERHLHLDKGYAEREIHWQSPSGHEIKISFRRLISFEYRELFAIDIFIEGINFTGPVKIVSTVNGNVRNYTAVNDPRVASGHAQLLSVKECGTREEYGYVMSETTESSLQMACVTRHEYSGSPQVQVDCNATKVEHTYIFSLEEPMHLTKWNIYTDTLRHGEHPIDQGIELQERLKGKKFEDLLILQKDYMDQFWKSSDIIIENDTSIQEGIRFNVYQLLQSAGRDSFSNISAKGLSGEGYEGHYFWDTEIYLFPVFLMTHPDMAKQLLLYRYSTLEQAKDRAREMGHAKGALFPWRTISGTECSSFFPSGTAQYHISADIAYSYIQYYLAEDDRNFLLQYGAEVLFETARLWIEIGHDYKGGFHIDEVTGPDEYTCCVNNNYYTNVMAQNNLKWAVKSYEILKAYDQSSWAELCNRLEVSPDEVESWNQASITMYLPFDEELGVNPQDDTFLRKKVWDFENTPKDKYPLLLNYHPLTIYRYQVCKQADTVLAHFLIEDAQDMETIQHSYDYYEGITTHDSSLSTCIFSIMASKVGYMDKAYEYFTETARLDLDNTHGNTKDGLHLANMGGTWMAIVYGFAGLRLKESGLSLAPSIPTSWERYAFRIRYRGRLIQVQINNERIQLGLLEGKELTVQLYEEHVILKLNDTINKSLK